MSSSDSGVLRIPPDVHMLAGFRRWVHSGELPEKLRTHFINGMVYLDMSEESIQSHVFVKVGIFATLMGFSTDSPAQPAWSVELCARSHLIGGRVLMWDGS